MHASVLCLLCVAALVLQTEASVTITSTHTQQYTVGDTVTITWNSNSFYNLYYISLAQGGTTFKSEWTSSKSYSYTISSSVTSDITVTVQDYYDSTSATVTLQIQGSFTLYAPSPNATTSSTALIKWDAQGYGVTTKVTLKCYSASNFALIQTITTSTLVSAKQYSWTAPSSVGMYYLVGTYTLDSVTYSDTTGNFAVNSPNGAVTAVSVSVSQVTYSASDSLSVAWSYVGLPFAAPVTFYIVNQQTGKVYQSPTDSYAVNAQAGYMSMPSASFPSGQYRVRIQAAGVNQTSNASFSSSGTPSYSVTLPTAAIAGISAGSFVVFIIIAAGVCACVRSGALAAACCCCHGAITSGPAPAKTTEIAVSYNNVGTTGSPQMQLAMAPQSGPVGYPQPTYQPGYNPTQTAYMPAPQHFSPAQTPAATNGDYAAYLQGGHRPPTAPSSTVMMPSNGYMVTGPNMTQTMYQQPVYMTADASQMSYMQTQQQQPGGYMTYPQMPYAQQVPVGYATAPPPSYDAGAIDPSV